MEMNPSEETSPIGRIVAELQQGQALIPNSTSPTSTDSTEVLRTPQRDIKNPAKDILKKVTSVTPLLMTESDGLTESDGWITVPGSKSTRNPNDSQTSQPSGNLTRFKYSENTAVDYGSNNGS